MVRLMRAASSGLVFVALLGLCILASSCSPLRHDRMSSPLRSMPVPPAKAFVTGTDLKTLRDDYEGWIGMKITVGPAPISVTALGRYVAPGNNRDHMLKIVQAEGGGNLARVSLSLAGAAAGTFRFAPLPTPATLQAGTSYYVVTRETFDSDQWYHSDTTVSTTDAALCDSAVYWSNINQEWTTEALKNNTFGPVSFLYQ